MPPSQLSSRVAIVTGAGRGIGRAIALGYAREGALIAGVARTEAELDSLTEEISAFGGKAIGVVADLVDSTAPARVVAETMKQFGTIDILVNNAGIGTFMSPRPVADFDDAFWDFSLTLNLTVPYRFAKLTMPIFMRQKRGRIVNIASLASKIGLLHGAAYAASKHGLLGLTKTLAIEGAPHGITANSICPGPVRTAMNEQRMRYDADRQGTTVAELEAKINPIGRRLESEEIVPLAILLASDPSGAITGQAFNICGGMVMS
jgi:NAD(P)-dependent dehydrogenase (short-subunit alcohol dehydrogenase family)